MYAVNIYTNGSESRLACIHLKRYGKHANNHVGQSQIGDEQIGDRLHWACGRHDPDDQRVADDRQQTDAAVQDRQYDKQADGNIVQLFCEQVCVGSKSRQSRIGYVCTK